MYHATVLSYLVTQPHDTAGWADGDETTRHKPLDAGLLGRFSERDLVLLFGGTDTADDHIDLSQSFDELFLGGLQVAFPNLNAPILETCDGRLLGRNRTDKSDDFL
jgi:hypothetical protein